MGIFRRKPKEKKPTKPQKQEVVQPVGATERVLTAEGWRRRLLKKTK